MSEILIQSSDSRLVPGEPTTVPIILRLDRETKVRGLHATFHGAEETKATYTTYNAATKSTQTHTAIEHVDIVKNEIRLSGNERMGFFGNLADGLATLLGGGEHEVLQSGDYPFEIEVEVPKDARPSFQAHNCRVFYELAVRVDIPAARDLTLTHSFEVTSDSDANLESSIGSVRTRYPEDQERGLLDCWFGPDIRVEAALDEGLLREGDAAEGFIHVVTAKTLDYRVINARLIAVENTAAQGHTDTHVHKGEPITIATAGSMMGTHNEEFQLPVRSPGAITARGTLFSIDCFVQIEFDVPWAKDPKIRIPVTIIA